MMFSRFMKWTTVRQKTVQMAFASLPQNGRSARAVGLVTVGLMGYYSLIVSRCEAENEAEEASLNVQETLQSAIKKSQDMCRRFMSITGTPGMTMAVSVDGKLVYKEGFGYSDLENSVPCSPDTVMRIASISKSITMATVAKLWEMNKLDLDKPIQEYLPTYPEKTWEGQKVDITTRHLVSHLGGIRHYSKKLSDEEKKELEISDENTKQTSKDKQVKEKKMEKNEKNEDIKKKNGQTENDKKKEIKNESNKDEFKLKEYYIKEKYDTLEKALELFKDDPLLIKPDTKFLYTTHGWTLVSAVVEAVVEDKFPTYMKKMFKVFGLEHTYLDENEPIIQHRACNYIKNKKGQITNAPYVDNSYKWAGGGFLSTASDLVKFGNAMLYSYQHDGKTGLPAFLHRDTMRKLWTAVPKTVDDSRNTAYGMGWQVQPEKSLFAFCKEQRYNVFHTGGAIGASSVLFILTPKEGSTIPRGVVVAIIINMQATSVLSLARNIANIFESIDKALI